MGILRRKNSIQESAAQPMDPLGLEQSAPAAVKAPRTKKKLRRKEAQQVVRVEKIREALAASGEDVNLDAVVSLYLPQRRARRFGAALLRLNKLYLLLLGLLLLLAILFIFSFSQEKMGNFTINLNRLEMYRKGISISADPNFSGATARLVAESIPDATNISIADLPEDLDDVDGGHNGKNYMAYTYYVRNAGKEDLSYCATIQLDASAKGAEEAVRVAVWRNGERTVYAAPAADGGDEEGCTSFLSKKIVCTYVEPEFLVGNVDRYTVAIWMEGDDPECVDDIIGGSVQFSMDIDADSEDDTGLLRKFVQDVIDTITGNRPIYGSSDSSVPDYYLNNEITWENRRNQ